MKGFFVYCFYDSSNNLLYIGKTTQLENRMRQHFSKDSLELDKWKNMVDKKNLILHECQNPVDLDIYETFFINKYTPIYNKDKIFNSIPTFELPYLQPIPYAIKDREVLIGSFKDCCIRYTESSNEEKTVILEKYPVIKEAFELLGEERMKSLSYNIHRIKDELQLKSDITAKEIKSELLLALKLDTEYTITEVKEIFNSIYSKLGINKKGTSHDIEEYFKIERKKRKIKGLSTRLIEIIDYNL